MTLHGLDSPCTCNQCESSHQSTPAICNQRHGRQTRNGHGSSLEAARRKTPRMSYTYSRSFPLAISPIPVHLPTTHIILYCHARPLLLLCFSKLSPPAWHCIVWASQLPSCFPTCCGPWLPLFVETTMASDSGRLGRCICKLQPRPWLTRRTGDGRGTWNHSKALRLVSAPSHHFSRADPARSPTAH